MGKGFYNSIKDSLSSSENGIVGFWDVVTKVLSYVSLLEVFMLIKKRWVSKKNQNEQQEESASPDSIYYLIEIWVVAHVFIAILASAIVFYDLTADNKILLYSLAVYGSLRVFEIIIKQIRVIMFDTIGVNAVHLKSARRSIILLIHNVVEMIFWFSVSIMVVCLSEIKTVGGSYTHLSEIFYWSDFIRCSTLQFITFGDDYTAISKLIDGQNLLINITFWEILVGFLIIVISLARFFSLLPTVKCQDEVSEKLTIKQRGELGSVNRSHEKMKKIFEQVKKCATNYPNIYKIVMFGSRARGDYRDNSDVDLAIFSKSSSNLEVANFTSDIEDLDTLLKFDIVFITPDTDAHLLENVKKEGVVIMELLSNKVENFKRAVERLSEGLSEHEGNKSSVVRDGVIQRFEFTTELAWKATREYLMDQGFVEINSPKAVMKEAFSFGLISDDTIWIQILNDRNLTSHIYKEELADEICDRIIKTHYQELKALSKRLAE